MIKQITDHLKTAGESKQKIKDLETEAIALRNSSSGHTEKPISDQVREPNDIVGRPKGPLKPLQKATQEWVRKNAGRVIPSNPDENPKD